MTSFLCAPCPLKFPFDLVFPESQLNVITFKELMKFSILFSIVWIGRVFSIFEAPDVRGFGKEQ